jgi:pectin methylesterase-like acyl-CoA thioesterase
MPTYTYSIALDTLNGIWNQPKLWDEITFSEQITVATLTGLIENSGNIEATFDLALGAEEPNLTYIVNNHDGAAMSPDIDNLTANQTQALLDSTASPSNPPITQDDLIIDQWVTVGSGAGVDYTTIQDAIDAITDAASDKQYGVRIYPGEYPENITMKSWVHLLGVDSNNVCINPTSGTVIAWDTGTSEISRVNICPDYGTLTANETIMTLTAGTHVMDHCVLETTKAGGNFQLTALNMSGGVFSWLRSGLDVDINGGNTGGLNMLLEFSGTTICSIIDCSMDLDVGAAITDIWTLFGMSVGGAAVFSVATSRVSFTYEGSAPCAGMYFYSNGTVNLTGCFWEVSGTDTTLGGFISSGGAVANTYNNVISVTSSGGAALAGSIGAGDTWNSNFDSISAANGITGAGTVNVVGSSAPSDLTISGDLTLLGNLTDGTDSLTVDNARTAYDHSQITTGNPHSVTKAEVGLGNVTNDAQLKRAAGDFDTFTAITTVAPDDIILVEDASDSYNKKEVQLTNLPSGVIGVVLVDMTAGTRQEYATITAALAAASAGDTVLVGPGTYAESFTIPAGVVLKGQGGSRVTKITGSLATGTRVTLSNGCVFWGFSVTLPTNATYAVQYAGATPSLAVSRDILFIGNGASGKCYGQTGTGSSEIMDVFVQQGSMACVYEVTNGELFVRSSLISKFVTAITDACLVSGGLLALQSFVARGSGIVDGISVGAGAVTGATVELQDFSGSAIHMTNDAGTLEFRGLRCHNCNKDLEVDSGVTDATVHILCSEMLESKVDVPQAWHDTADHMLQFQDQKIGDTALKVWGELHVGSWVHGRESAFGEGDENTSGMYGLRNTNQEAGTWSDVTTQLRSAESSTFNLFPGVGANNCFYLGGDYPYSGSYVNIDTAGVPGTGTAIFEYWNGATWVAAAIMATEAKAPREQYGPNIGGLSGEIKVRASQLSGWATKSLNGTTAYWTRYRITSSYTTSPIIQQMKLTLNAVEIGADGFIEFFGNARPQRSLPWHLGLLEDASGQDPSNENVRFSTNVEVALLDNEFNNGVSDGRAGIIEIPYGIDTSYPLTLRWVYAQNQGVTGDVNFDLYYSKARVGDRFLGTFSETNISDIVTLSSGLTDDSYELEHTIPIYDMVPGDLLGIALSRDASAGNLDDTFNGNIYLIATSASGYFWR